MELTKEQTSLMVMPSGYAKVRLGLDLHPWQRKCVDSLFPEHSMAALRTCNESGKTSCCIATLVLWHMDVFPGSKIVTTSASNKQIQHQLYPELQRLVSKLEGKWKISNSANDHSVRGPNNSVCISYSTDDEQKSEGYHEQKAGDFMDNWTPPKEWKMDGWVPDEKAPLLIIMDECKGINDERFNAFDRCNPTRIFYASSPGNPIGRFYDNYNSHKPKFRNPDGTYNLFHASYLDCPHLLEDPEKLRKLELEIEIRGETDAWVQSYAFGEFAQSGSNMVFNMFKVDQAMSGMIRQYDERTIRAAVDLSGGGDEQVLFIRRGNKAEMVGAWRIQDYHHLCDVLCSNFERLALKPEWIRADRGGLGDPICSMLARQGWDVERMDFGGRPKNTNKYLNLRSEMYFELAQAVAQGHAFLPRDNILREQLGWQEYNMDDQQRLTIIPKTKMPRSPDRADTVAMLYYDMAPVEQIIDDQEILRRRLSATLPDHPRTGFYEEQELDEGRGLFF